MILTRTDYEFKKVAAILGTIQALGFGVMSIICIILYLEGTIRFTPNHYMHVLNVLMYNFFLAREPEVWNIETFRGQTMTSHVFHGFMWVYLILDLVWLITSLRILQVRKEEKLQKALKAWSHTTLTISSWDFITVIILGVDYNRCMTYCFDNSYIAYEMHCANAILPVLVLAARGFVLWIVNVIFAIILIKMVKRLEKGPVVQHLPPIGLQIPHPIHSPYVDGFGQYPPRPAHFAISQNLSKEVYGQHAPSQYDSNYLLFQPREY